MMPNRRILVASEESATGSDVKHQKFAVSLRPLLNLTPGTQISQVSIDSAATNDDLAKQIANYLDRERNSFTLELPGGFKLRGQE